MKKIIGYTTGVFDLFHIGHLKILQNARSLCDKLIVGVTTDELVLMLDGKSAGSELSSLPHATKISTIDTNRAVKDGTIILLSIIIIFILI